MATADVPANNSLLERQKRRRRDALYERQGSDLWLLAVVVALTTFGLLMIYSATYALSYFNFDGETNWYLMRQLQWTGIGIVVLLICWRLDYHVWQKLSMPLMTVTVLVLIAMIFMGQSRWGASRWILEGGSVQPSEAAKIATFIYVAHWASSKGERIRQVEAGLIPFGILLGTVCGLILLQPSFSTAFLVGSVCTTMFFIAGADLKQLAITVTAATGGAYFIMRSATYRVDRLIAFQDPFAHELGKGWQTTQVLYSLARGGWLGQGLGTSKGNLSANLPIHTDSIMAIVGQELGLLACWGVIALFLFLAYRGFRIAAGAPDAFGMVLASGLTCWILYQALMNLAVTTNTIPTTGVPIPFISFGGSGLITAFAGIGMLLSISRAKKRPIVRNDSDIAQ